MGDVFRGGNQNVIASIDSEKGRMIIPTKSLTKKDLENLPIEVNIVIIY